MAAPTAFRSHQQHERYSDQDFLAAKRQAAKPKPPKQADSPLACPYCHQPLPYSHATYRSVLSTGVRGFGGAIWMLWHALVRCIRFATGGIFCLLGAAGLFLLNLGERIVHPADRRFVSRRK
jgi:hypothetical protein